MDAGLLALLALGVSIVSAFFAWQSASQAKRQANAVMGDVPPSISLYQPIPESFRSFAVIALEIVNHNRRPIYIERWKFDFPEEMTIFQDHDDSRKSIAAIIDAVRNGKRDFTPELPLRLAGNSDRDPAPFLNTSFHIAGPRTDEGAKPTDPFDLAVTVWYRVDGSDTYVEETRRVTWRPVEGSEDNSLDGLS